MLLPIYCERFKENYNVTFDGQDLFNNGNKLKWTMQHNSPSYAKVSGKTIARSKVLACYKLQNSNYDEISDKELYGVISPHFNNDIIIVNKSMYKSITNMRNNTKIYDDLEDEEWRIFNEVTLVSNKGRVKNIEGSEYSYHYDKDGYVCVSLNGIANRSYKVHRLVYQMFKGELVDGLVIKHLDSNKEHNDIKNLEQDTQKSNVHDAIIDGLWGEEIREKFIQNKLKRASSEA